MIAHLILLLLSTNVCSFSTSIRQSRGSSNSRHGCSSSSREELSIPVQLHQEGIIIDGIDNDQVKDTSTEERNLRFAGVGRLYAKGPSSPSPSSTSLPDHLEVIDKLTKSTVTVVGLGGVGSWAAEALCRSGIGNLVLIDLDDICISNTNRQLHSVKSSIGQMKIDWMKQRLHDINPQCNVTLIHDFVSTDNVYDILDKCCGPSEVNNNNNNMNALLDAMDGTKEKTALIAACVKRRIPVVTCGAAAGRMDPTKIIVQDLIHVANDRLLASIRKSLRQSYGFERGLKLSEMKKIKSRAKKTMEWKIQAVFSTEEPRPVCTDDNSSSLRRCDGPMGTACFVTGTYGFVAASRIVDMIATGTLIVPKQQQGMDTGGG